MVNPQGQPPVGKAGTPGADRPRQPRSVWDSDPWGTERGDSGPLTRTVCGHEGGRPPGPLPAFPRPAQLHTDTVSRLRPQVHQRHVLTGVHWGRGAQHTAFRANPFQKPPLPLQPLSSPYTYPSLPSLRPPHDCLTPHPALSSCPPHPRWWTRPWCCPGACSAGERRRWVRPQRRRPAGRPQAGGSAWPEASGRSAALAGLPGDSG